MKKKLSRLNVVRYIIQALCFFFLPSLFAAAFESLRSIYITILKGNLNTIIIVSNIITLIAIIPVTMLAGRFFCGWMCAFGTLNEFVYTLTRKIFKKRFHIHINEKLDFYLKFIKYAVLAGCVVFIWSMNMKKFSTASPWDAFGQIPLIKTALAVMPTGILLLILILFASLFVERFFCRYLCPLGAILAIISKVRLFKIYKDREICGKCRVCTIYCPMGIPLYKSDIITYGECINCMRCISVCPKKHASFNLAKNELTPVIAGTVAAASMAGIYYIPHMVINKREHTIGNDNLPGEHTPGSIYKDGTYTGVSAGYRPNFEVSVTVLNDKITRIIILSNNESVGYRESPFNIIPQRIIERQSTAVPVVSGATFTCNGIRSAVENALNKAMLANLPIDSDPETPSPEPSSDGTNTATPDITPTPSITDENPSGLPDETYNTPGVSPSESMKNTPSHTVEKSPESTPAPSSSISSQDPALTPSHEPSLTPTPTQTPTPTPVNKKYNDGEYTGTGGGYSNIITVKVTILNDKIISIVITEHEESDYGTAFTDIPKRIIDSQSTNVDIVSGATWSSKGVIQGVGEALRKALRK